MWVVLGGGEVVGVVGEGRPSSNRAIFEATYVCSDSAIDGVHMLPASNVGYM